MFLLELKILSTKYIKMKIELWPGMLLGPENYDAA